MNLEKIIKLGSDQEAISLYGSLDERLRFAEEKFKVRISARNHRLVVSGAKENVKSAVEFFTAELERIREKDGPNSKTIHPPSSNPEGRETKASEKSPVTFFHKGKLIKAKSKNQE